MRSRSSRIQANVFHRAVTARWGRALSALLLVLLALAVSLLPATAQRPNGAGIVIQFEDGSHIYAYVQFSEESISSEQLLTRSGLDVIMAPYGGMGAAVCSIQGQGCPSSNCFCHSYSYPAFFWHFYAWDGASWVEQLQGSTSRGIVDGDIDGWLWSSGDTSLPAVTIEEIAAINGIDLSEPEDTATPTPSPEPTATATPAPEPSPTPNPTSTATADPSPTPTADISATASPTNTMIAIAPSATPTRTVPPTARATAASPTATVAATSTPLPTLTVQAGTTAVAVFVPVDGPPEPLNTTQADDGQPLTAYAVFAGMLALGLGAAAFAVVRGRAASSTEDAARHE